MSTDIRTVEGRKLHEASSMEYLVVQFPGNRVTGDGFPLLVDLVARGVIRILDLVFATRDADGGIRIVDIYDVDGAAHLDPAVFCGAAPGLLGPEDIQQVTRVLERGSSAGILVYENVWAAPFAAAVRRGGAQLVASGRIHIPEDLVLHPALAAAGGGDAPSRRSETAGPGLSLESRVETLILMAEQSLWQRNPGRGQALLEQALRVAEPDLIRRPFLLARIEVRALLMSSGLYGRNRWLRDGAAPQHRESAAQDEPLQQRSPSDVTDVTPTVMPLTAKETEVLGYVAQLLTTEEIAAAMFLSVHTVRSHVRGILRKLGVGRRNEAVRRAWALGLLPSTGRPSSTPVAM